MKLFYYRCLNYLVVMLFLTVALPAYALAMVAGTLRVLLTHVVESLADSHILLYLEDKVREAKYEKELKKSLKTIEQAPE